MLSDLQRRKLTRCFQAHDLDQNGYIERADFDRAAQRGATQISAAPGAPEFQKIHSNFLGLWQLLQTDMDVDADQRVSLEEFLNGWERLYTERRGEFRHFLDGMWAAIDFNQDNRLSAEEWRGWMTGLGVAGADADAQFKRLDRDNRGYLTKEQYVQAWEEFHFSADPDAPGNWNFGPF